MPQGKLRPTLAEVKALLTEDRDFLRPLVQAVLQELLEAEMTEALGAEKGERSASSPPQGQPALANLADSAISGGLPEILARGWRWSA